ncbi:MAG: CNNM domain-containing protein [Verrucomicrobia bacterium]|nr:CNNM domain-containing protein [Verrucomicrobiota bacterium]
MNLSFMDNLLFLAFSASSSTQWEDPSTIALKLSAILALVFLNGFFVAAEFALVKVRASQLESMAEDGNSTAALAHHLTQNLEAYLSACQLGITLASLGLGWIGEPFLAQMLQPFFLKIGITSPAVIQYSTFAIAFSTITTLHITLGEQAPKTLHPLDLSPSQPLLHPPPTSHLVPQCRLQLARPLPLPHPTSQRTRSRPQRRRTPRHPRRKRTRRRSLPSR